MGGTVDASRDDSRENAGSKDGRPDWNSAGGSVGPPTGPRPMAASGRAYWWDSERAGRLDGRHELKRDVRYDVQRTTARDAS